MIKIFFENLEIKDYKIEKFELLSSENDHSSLHLDLHLKEEINFFENIKIIYENENIFVGKVQKIEKITYSNEGKLLKVLAKSKSIILDGNLNYRIFQDEKITYKQIVEKIVSKYNLNFLISKNLDKETCKMYVQYNESDFNFLKRILSDINEQIYISYAGNVLFGFTEISKIKLKNIISSSSIKDKNGIYKSYYMQENIALCAENENDFIVHKSRIYMKNNIIYSEIKLKNKKNICSRISSNIKGAHIKARVVKVFSKDDIAKMHVDFTNEYFTDDSINKKAFSFSTPYSKVSSGLYITPEISDVVSVYFPSDEENDAAVAFCIDNEKSSRFCDYDNKNYISKSFTFDISNDKAEFSIKNLNIKSDKIKLNAEYVFTDSKSIDLNTTNDINLKAANLIKLSASKIFNN